MTVYHRWCFFSLVFRHLSDDRTHTCTYTYIIDVLKKKTRKRNPLYSYIDIARYIIYILCVRTP